MEFASVRATTPHNEVIDILNKKRLVLSPPMASNFRVLCLMLLKTRNEEPAYVLGMNFEPANIGGSICAERSAIGQLHLHNDPTITKIFIVTDAEQPISPGTLCREFLTSKCLADTPIVLADCSGQLLVECTVGYLFPHPFLYRTTGRYDIEACANQYLQGKEHNDIQALIKASCGEDASNLYEKALNAAKMDVLINLHPLRLGAGVLYADGTTEVTWQIKALEYGSTLDPVCQLMTYFERNKLEGIKTSNPEMLLMVDQFGIIHAPFGQARAVLCEHGYNDLKVILMQDDGAPEKVALSTLVPGLNGFSGSMKDAVF